jgi:general secretion pathway protein C
MAPMVLQGALALALAIQATRLLWIALAPMERPEAAAVVPAPQPDSPAALSGHGDPFYPQANDATRTTGYTLLGVRVTAGGGAAILARDGRQVAYAVGDELAKGVTLAAVASDHVVLRAGGREHRIALARPASRTLPAPHALPVGAPPEPTDKAPP